MNGLISFEEPANCLHLVTINRHALPRLFIIEEKHSMTLELRVIKCFLTKSIPFKVRFRIKRNSKESNYIQFFYLEM